MPIPFTILEDTQTILHLIHKWETLNQHINTKNRLDMEHQKLLVIKAFETIVKKQIPPQYRVRIQEEQDEALSFVLSQTAREAIYTLLLALALLQDAAGNYLFGSTLFALIPGLSNPMLILASILFVLLSSILSYAFDVTFLKNALGLPCANTDLGALLEIYTSQLKITITINHLLSTMYMLHVDNDLYNEYMRMLSRLNDDLRLKDSNMDVYYESTFKYSLKICLLVFGAVSNVAGSYFMTNTIMTLLTPSLIGTPIGWTIISMGILVGLGFYYAMGVTSLYSLVNPDFDAYQTTQKDLHFFKKAYPDDLKLMTAIKGRFFEKKTMTDATTQTENQSLLTI